MKKHIVIVGSGMGGLATALRLAHAGFRVTVLEKNSRMGGRSGVIEERGFRVDTGPTILVMKSTLEDTYRAIGQDLNARLEFTQLDPNYRIYFHDGTFMDLYANMARLASEAERIMPGAAERVFQFLGAGASKYERGMAFVDRNFDHLTDLFNPGALVDLLATGAHENLYAQVRRYFNGSDKLAKAFSFHSMFLGLSPLDSLAMYSLITYADLALGMWYPRGGIYSIIEDMLALATEMGVTLRTSAPVEEILVDGGRVTGVRLEGGDQIAADVVVSNADLPYTYERLVAARHRPRTSDSRLAKMRYACSGYLLYLGVDRVYPQLRHQALYFSEDYRANLDAIFKTKTLPDAPSFHLNCPSVSDPGLAPAGHSLLYVLAPMPNLTAGIDWETAAPRVREQLLAQLERLVDPDLRAHIVWEKQFRPDDFQSRFNAVHGTAFGSLSHDLLQSAYFRPHNRDRDIEGLYFVGQGTYPGIGMPMVHLSAKLVTERILKSN